VDTKRGLTSRRSQLLLALAVPSRLAGRFTSRVGGGSAFCVRHLQAPMSTIEFIAIFGGLFFWPTFMVFHHRWSRKARILGLVFLSTLLGTFGFGGWFIYVLSHGSSIHQLWPLQFVFPIITIGSFIASFILTFACDEKGDVV